jgi:Flp pilus assembly protein TadB
MTEDFQILAARELPDFMSRIALLLTAGIPLTAAWERSLTPDSETSGGQRKERGAARIRDEDGRGRPRGWFREWFRGRRAVSDVQGTAGCSDLEMELRQVVRDMKQGMAFVSALEALARRRPCQEIQTFVMLLSQNAKKGRGELARVLRGRARQGWETRKQLVRRQGEAAFIKMLFPMALMLIAILLIVTAPAVMTLS